MTISSSPPTPFHHSNIPLFHYSYCERNELLSVAIMPIFLLAHIVLCRYSCADGDHELIPANKFKRLSAILQKYYHPLRSRLPGFKSSNQPDEQIRQTLLLPCADCGPFILPSNCSHLRIPPYHFQTFRLLIICYLSTVLHAMRYALCALLFSDFASPELVEGRIPNSDFHLSADHRKA